jgi:serine protease Do
MNSAIFSPTGGSVGIGFAIPSNVIRSVAAQLEASGHVTRGYIGVEAQELTGVTDRALRLADNGGALLSSVLPNGPASKAGLESGDVIQGVNGQKVTNPRELALEIASIKPGEDAHLTVLHDGHSKDVTLKVALANTAAMSQSLVPDKTGHKLMCRLIVACAEPVSRC